VQLTDKLTNLYRENIDLALRYGSPRDSNLISLSVCENNYRVLCASPVYLDHHGSPESPLDLVNHNCLCFNLNGSINNKWSFYSDEHEIEVTVGGNRCSDDGDFVRRWAIEGRGIAYKSFLDVSEDLLSGKLVQLCREWKGETFPLKLLFTDRRQLTPAVLALKESLSNTCQQAMAKYETK
jgi:DNA-binding transcriptional LysR family regulator